MARGFAQRGFAGVAVCAAALVASDAAAQVLTTIAIDGNMSDWSAVLADPFQTAHDGPYPGYGDLDAPVPSTGRDLTTFAWTYDPAYLHFYVARVASSSNRQRFWFYLDIDEDDRMETGEPVVQVSWFGSNRVTDVELWVYAAASPAGDPMGDPGGLADGWTLPGTVALVRTIESVRGGSSSGVEMESRIAWSDLGIAPESPVRFHVSSSNSTNLPQQVHDNMGGPGGVVGTTRVAGVTITPASVAADGIPGGVSAIAHRVTNLGSSADRFDLSWTSSGDFAPTGVTFVLDLDGDGAVDPGEPTLIDTDADGLPDHGPIAAGAGFDLIVVVGVPAGSTDGDAIALDVTATSAGVPGVSDTAADTITLRRPAVTLVKSVDRVSAVPGDVLTYTITYASSGSVDAREVVVLDPVPGETEYVAGSATGTGTLIEFSHDGGTSFDGSEVAPVTHIRWRLSAPLAPGDSGAVAFQARVR